MTKIIFMKGDSKIPVEAKPDQTLLDVAQENNIEIDHACGGNGYCTTCVGTIKDNQEALSELSEQEKAMGVEDIENQRLCCQARVKDSEKEIIIELPND